MRNTRDPRHLARDGREYDRRHRRRPAPDVGGAVLPPRRAALADHLGRPRRWGSRCPPSALACLEEVQFVASDGGFQMTMPSWRRSPRRSWTSRSRSSTTATWAWRGMAGVLLRAPLARDAAAQSGFVKIADALRPSATAIPVVRVESGDRGGAAPEEHGDSRVPRRAGRHGLSDGAAGAMHAMIRRPSRSSKPRRMRIGRTHSLSPSKTCPAS